MWVTAVKRIGRAVRLRPLPPRQSPASGLRPASLETAECRHHGQDTLDTQSPAGFHSSHHQQLKEQQASRRRRLIKAPEDGQLPLTAIQDGATATPEGSRGEPGDLARLSRRALPPVARPSKPKKAERRRPLVAARCIGLQLGVALARTRAFDVDGWFASSHLTSPSRGLAVRWMLTAPLARLGEA